MQEINRSPYVWDYDLNQNEFLEILAGRLIKGRLNQDWAAIRLIEYGSYQDIIQFIGFKNLIKNWENWRDKIRSKSRVRGLDFLVQWLPEKHPELLYD